MTGCCLGVSSHHPGVYPASRLLAVVVDSKMSGRGEGESRRPKNSSRISHGSEPCHGGLHVPEKLNPCWRLHIAPFQPLATGGGSSIFLCLSTIWTNGRFVWPHREHEGSSFPTAKSKLREVPFMVELICQNPQYQQAWQVQGQPMCLCLLARRLWESLWKFLANGQVFVKKILERWEIFGL